MPAFDRLLSTFACAAATGALAGLVARRRADACWSFLAYLSTAIAGHALVVVLPSALVTWGFVLATDVAQTGLRGAIAFEIAFRTFMPLPAGLRKVRRVFGVGALLIALGVWLYPGEMTSAFDLTLLVARVSYGVSLLFAAFLGLTAYYYVPVDPVHRDLAIGFVLLSVLAAFTAPLSALDPIVGWSRDFLVRLSYPLLLVWWARRAWAEEEPTALSREAMQILQPWRVKRIRWE